MSRERPPRVAGGHGELILAVRFDLVTGTEANCPHVGDQ